MKRTTLLLLLAALFLGVGLIAVFSYAKFNRKTVSRGDKSHQIVANHYHHTFSAAHAVLKRVRPGDKVITKTIDAGGQDENDVRRSMDTNPLTGPFYIEGAEPNDALIVRFTKIRLNRKWGWSNYRLGLVSLAPESIERTYADQYKENLIHPGRSDLVPWELDLERQMVRLREPVSKVIKLEFPAKPMLGCVGVAAESDWAPTSGPSGPYGGNLDYNEIVEGSVVMLPIYHPGALFFIGDGHALQADGEPMGTGIETSMDVEFTVDVRKKGRLTGPRVETSEYIISIGSQPEFASSLDRALSLATSDMVNWLVKEYRLEPWAAHSLIGYQGKYDVVTVAGSMALKIPKMYLPARQ
jgi:amidase